jgi:HEPN domain-containing protein
MRLEELAHEWLSKASEDIRSARFLTGLKPEPLEIIGFHSQQALEKSFKAILVLQGQEPPKTHDLLYLYEICGANISISQNIRILCGQLNGFAVEHRYPGTIEIDEAYVHEQLEQTEIAIFKIKEFLVSHFENT